MSASSFHVKARPPSRVQSALPFYSYPKTTTTAAYPTMAYPATSYPTTSYHNAYPPVYHSSFSSAYPIDPYLYRSGYFTSAYDRYQLPFQNLPSQQNHSAINNNQNNNIYSNKNANVTNNQNNTFSF